MFGSNPNHEMYPSQSLSQLDSQDWNFHLRNSQEFNQNVPTNNASRVLPPTPSSSRMQGSSLSSRWSRGLHSNPPTPQSLSQANSSPQMFLHEPQFLREIRFSLHAVLAVSKELPGKLKDVLIKSLDEKIQTRDHLNSDGNQHVSHQEKLIFFLDNYESRFEKIDGELESVRSFVKECKEMIIEEKQNLANFNEGSLKREKILNKRINVLKKTCFDESQKLENILQEIVNLISENGVQMEKMEKSIEETQNILKNFQEQNLILFSFFQKHKEDSNRLKRLLNEMGSMKVIFQNLPFIIKSSVKEAIEESASSSLVAKSSERSNVRLANSRHSSAKCGVKAFSPVARVTPQIKRPAQKLDVTYTEDLRKNQNCVLDVIDFCNRISDSPTSDICGFEKNKFDSESDCSSDGFVNSKKPQKDITDSYLQQRQNCKEIPLKDNFNSKTPSDRNLHSRKSLSNISNHSIKHRFSPHTIDSSSHFTFFSRTNSSVRSFIKNSPF